MNCRKPLPAVSIGLAVCNGERYLRAGIDSLLSQTYRDLELIICDNASNDRTQQICRDFAAHDGRIRYYRSEYRLSSAENCNRAFNLSRGHYFKWAEADDLYEPQLLERCICQLEAEPTAAMVFTRTHVIDPAGNVISDDGCPLATDSPSPVRRYRELICAEDRSHDASEIFGLYRRSVLARTNLLERVCHGESLLLVRCALMGRFIRIDDGLLLKRDRGSRSTRPQPSQIQHESVLARLISARATFPATSSHASKRAMLVFPEWVMAREYFRAISQTPLTPMQKRLCRFWWALFLARNARKLLRDPLWAAEYFVFRALDRYRRPRLVAQLQGRPEPSLSQPQGPALDVTVSTP